MNQKQKNKFHKAIKSLTELLDELNAGNEVWELRYSSSDSKFHLAKMGLINSGWTKQEQDDTYFPFFDIEE